MESKGQSLWLIGEIVQISSYKLKILRNFESEVKKKSLGAYVFQIIISGQKTDVTNIVD